MPDFWKKVKQSMIAKGREDFTNYLAEILGISKQSASQRMNGRVQLSLKEFVKLCEELELDENELKKTISGV